MKIKIPKEDFKDYKNLLSITLVLSEQEKKDLLDCDEVTIGEEW